MFTVKNHEPLKTEANAAWREPSKRQEAQASQLNPLWHRFATTMTAPLGNAARSKPLALQAKLTSSEPNDPYEQEADRVADQVMRMPDNTAINDQRSAISGGHDHIQTKPT